MEKICGDRALLTEECIGQLVYKVEMLEAENLGSMHARESLFLMIAAFNIFLMQLGFAMLEVGTVQTKNAKSVLFKNIIDCSIGILIWWLWGYGISNGDYRDLWRAGYGNTGIDGTASFFHSFTFSTTCATILSGGVVERMNFTAYLSISALMIGLIYPVVVSWVWTGEGWLYKLGYTDFAGTFVVHGLGGASTLAACYLLGPRIGRFRYDEEEQKWQSKEFIAHSPIFANLGIFILMFGWLSFNGSSVLGATEADFRIAMRSVINTFISGASSCMVGSLFFRYHAGVHNLEKMHNSLLVGLVSITGCCAYVDYYYAPVVGLVAVAFYHVSSKAMVYCRLDDPLDAVAIHGGGGIWGNIATGLFVNPCFTQGQVHGVLYGGWRLILVQLLGSVVILAWGSSLTAAMLLLFKRLALRYRKFPSIRAVKDAEILGLDFAYYDGFLFPQLDKSAIIAHHEHAAAKKRAMQRQKNLSNMMRIAKHRQSGSIHKTSIRLSNSPIPTPPNTYRSPTVHQLDTSATYRSPTMHQLDTSAYGAGNASSKISDHATSPACSSDRNSETFHNSESFTFPEEASPQKKACHSGGDLC
mmetsp:Transcript_2721/g.3874  ORF Transcript_2721/g.3874 Transcript_2721/m.3874 type:complete len:586 (+) Transcript_2721:170-1927(+)